MALHIHIYDGVFSRTSPQAFGALAQAERSRRSAEAVRATGATWQVQRRQKNGALASPSSMDVNLTEERAKERKDYLERLNPGNAYELVRT